jgi:two-component system, OmpR family, response regulator ChvI
MIQLLTRILVVDDEPDIATSMRAGLQRKGFQVDSFTSPADALAHYSPGAYQLLIVDVRMPDMDGFELFREIRKIDPIVKVRFLTAFDITEGEFGRVFPDMDYSLLVQKPIMIEQLVGIVKRILPSNPAPSSGQ